MDILETTRAKEHLSEAAIRNITEWLEKPKYAEYKRELLDLIEAGEWQQLEDAFFKVIEFGTGGRRGTTGVGSNRINRVTIGESTEALCTYMNRIDPEAASKGIVIAYDTRLSSEELSQYVASVSAANGFKTYIFESFRSTPELSFSVRELGCAAGIVITASHNPPDDNGFKAYWDDGCQLVPPHDKGVLEVAATLEEIHTIDYDEGVGDGRIIEIGEELDKKYIPTVVNQAEGTNREVAIVYSPLHGAGQRNTIPVLEAAGFTDVRPVEAQMVPDGNFPTIPSGKPNPEDAPANQMVVDKMLAEQADIGITNDPDADRIGVMVRQGDKAIYLTGNQSFVLATEYALRKKQEKGELTDKHYVAKTIVTTDMVDAIAKTYGVSCYGNLLIGFKYIGELIRSKEGGGETFVIGGEESYGLLKGDYTRDKDGAVGALPMAEYAADLKLEDKTLWDRLKELYKKHGLFIERLDTIVCAGAKGFDDMQAMMAKARSNPPQDIAGHTVTAVLDYQTLLKTDVETGLTTPIDCIKGNVIVLEFDHNLSRRVTVRPSGTEPKLKFYAQWVEPAQEDVDTQYENLQQHLGEMSHTLEVALREQV